MLWKNWLMRILLLSPRFLLICSESTDVADSAYGAFVYHNDLSLRIKVF